MAKAKKVDLKSFTITQVDNGWEIEAREAACWYDFFTHHYPLNTYVFNDLDELLEWIEANI